MVHKLTASHDANIVGLSIGIAFLGAYISICFCEQLRLCSIDDTHHSQFMSKKGLFSAMVLALGGVGIWTMHVIGVFAISLKAPDGTAIDIEFHLLYAIISLIIALVMSYVGLYFSSRDVMFGKTKQQIVELVVSDANKKLSIREIKTISNSKMLFIISTQQVTSLLLGGFIMASGLIVMQYIVMKALVINRGFILWDEGLIAASIIVAMFACILVFWILFRLLSLYPQMEWLRVLSAAIISIAIVGVHLIGIDAATFCYDPLLDAENVSTYLYKGEKHIYHYNKDLIYSNALVISVIFCFVLVIVAISDLRAWLHNMSVLVKRYEDMHLHLKKEHNQADHINAFLKRYEKVDHAVGRQQHISSNNESTASHVHSVVLVSATLQAIIDILFCRKRTFNNKVASSPLRSPNTSQIIMVAQKSDVGSNINGVNNVGDIESATEPKTDKFEKSDEKVDFGVRNVEFVENTGFSTPLEV